MTQGSGATPDTIERQDLMRLQASGLFDGAWFTTRNRDFTPAAHEALVHFHRFGWREGRWPNPYFDPAAYLVRYGAQCGDANPLLHYIDHGEADGLRPVPWFDPAWYRRNHSVPDGQLCLSHYLQSRCTGTVSAIPEFDSSIYLMHNPDVADAGMDPLEHYLLQGFQEGRRTGPVIFGRGRGRRGNGEGGNPLLLLLARQDAERLRPPQANIAAEVRRNTSRHPDFEEVSALPPGAVPRAKLLAFYLPQYHPVPENEAWWGRGFTEWTNVARAVPRFAGHYQPRIPRDLGHYRLDQGDTLRRQIALAQDAGVHAFVFYFYWFNGRALLDGPLNALLADPTLDIPICLMWANENWTRRWDGLEEDVLLSQDYREADEPALLDRFAACFRDPRYVRLQDRPLLMIYRPRLIPDTAATIGRWRRLFQADHGENPFFVMAQSFGDTDPRPFGMDAAVEFPPHKLTETLEMVNDDLETLDPDFSAEVYDYGELAAASLAEPMAAYDLIKTAVPGWDNDARRQGAGLVLHGATPDAYQAWVEQLVRRAAERPVGGEAIVCVNAWNEWAEGAYLEPDVHYGAAFLNATGRAVAALPRPGARTRLLLVGHDARAHGAQTLLLHIGQALRSGHGVDIDFLLLEGGVMASQYSEFGDVTIAQGAPAVQTAIAAARARGICHAIVNTAASAAACATLGENGIASILLIHEMPRLLREKALLPGARSGVAAAQRTVFAAAYVRDRFQDLIPLDPARTAVRPQGVHRLPRPDPAQRAKGRAELNVPPTATLAIGMGYADLRKGFDLFLQVWRAARDQGQALHCVWVGGVDPAIQVYLGSEIAAAEATGTFRCLGHRTDAMKLLAAADVFLLTSREDPLPSVVLEAMAAGLPTIAFEETGGVPDLLRQFDAGQSVLLGDVAAMARAIPLLAARFGPSHAAALAQASRLAFDFSSYCSGLLTLAMPGLQRISVVVPNYNYARYLPQRLASIFAQTYPVHEIIVLDDASSDDSIAVAEATAEAAARRIAVQWNAVNSGSVFHQWRRAAEQADGDWVWIAEADDLADPLFLATLVAALSGAPDAVMAFCDSASIDGAGRPLARDYQAYYDQTAPGLLRDSTVFEGRQFLASHLSERNHILNVSAVLWRRDALLAALHACETDLATFSVAGDWRVYAEALSQPGAAVAYVSTPLNTHRRHDGSVTSLHGMAAQRTEIARMHQVLAEKLHLEKAPQQRQRRYRRLLAEPAICVPSPSITSDAAGPASLGPASLPAVTPCARTP